MNNNLFCFLLNCKKLTVGTEVCVKMDVYADLVPVEQLSGVFTVDAIYANPLVNGTLIDVSAGSLKLTITKNDIKLIDGVLPSEIGESLGYVPLEIPQQPPEFYSHHPDGTQKRVRLKDSLDVFTAVDFTPDNYVEEKVTRDQFGEVTRVAL